MLRTIVGLAICLSALLSLDGGDACAGVTDQAYGSGVHAFFAGDYATAQRELTSAIDSGSKDPRCYYFRAMALLKLGRQKAAIADMKAGAALETQDSDRFYPIDQSLQRVQGRPRLMLQKYRREAQANALNAEHARSARRYEQIRRNEPEVLRRRLTVPLDSLAPSGGLVTLERRSGFRVAPPVTTGDADDPTDSGPVSGADPKVESDRLTAVVARMSGGSQIVDATRGVSQAMIRVAVGTRQAIDAVRQIMEAMSQAPAGFPGDLGPGIPQIPGGLPPGIEIPGLPNPSDADADEPPPDESDPFVDEPDGATDASDTSEPPAESNDLEPPDDDPFGDG